jgi:hypothetical protein
MSQTGNVYLLQRDHKDKDCSLVILPFYFPKQVGPPSQSMLHLLNLSLSPAAQARNLELTFNSYPKSS